MSTPAEGLDLGAPGGNISQTLPAIRKRSDRWRAKQADLILACDTAADVPALLAEVERLTEQLRGERLVHAIQEQRIREKHGKAPRLEDDPVAHTLGLVTPDRCRECGERNPEVERLRGLLESAANQCARSPLCVPMPEVDRG